MPDSPTEERSHNDADAINDLADAINDLAGVFNDYESQVKALQHKLIGAESKRDAALRILNEERDRANSAGVRVSALQAEVDDWKRVAAEQENRAKLQEDRARDLQAEVERLREAMDLAAHQIEGDAPMMGHVRANPAYTLRAALSPQPEERSK